MKRRIICLLLSVALLFYMTPAILAKTADSFKIRVSVLDLEGNVLNLSEANALVKTGTSIIWGKGSRMGGYGLGSTLNATLGDGYIEFESASRDDISFTLSCDNEKYAYFMSDTVKKEDLSNTKRIIKSYNLKTLKKIVMKTTFMNRSSGKYEVTVYSPEITNVEADNYGSTAAMKADGTKVLYISEGKYNFLFKYMDKGVCGLTCKNEVNTAATKTLNLAKENVSLAKYSYKVPRVLMEYNYYIMHAKDANWSLTAYLRGQFSDSGSLDFYMDSNIKSSAQRLIFSKNPDDEYECSVWVSNQRSIPVKLGESFSPGDISIFRTSDGKLSIEILFSDAGGNSIRFIELPRNDDMIVEIYDKVYGNLLYETKVSRYWDYFDPKLKAGSYLARIYPVEKAQGMDSCTYYSLTVDSSYQFKKMFSLKSVK